MMQNVGYVEGGLNPILSANSSGSLARFAATRRASSRLLYLPGQLASTRVRWRMV